MPFNQCNNNKLSTNTPLLFVIYGTALLINLCLFLPCLSLSLSFSITPSSSSSSSSSSSAAPLILSLRRAAQQSRWSVHVPPAAPSSPSAPRLHLCPPGALHSSQPAEEDHADAVPGQPGQPGGRHKLEHRPGAASQQLGAQQQHSPRDQVRECNKWRSPTDGALIGYFYTGVFFCFFLRTTICALKLCVYAGFFF